MKKTLSLLLAAGLLLAGLTACGNKSSAQPERTPEEWTTLYSDAVTENGGEMVEYNPVMTSDEDDLFEMISGAMGLTVEDMSAFAISATMMNVQAYAIAAIRPAEGKEETVTSALQTYVDNVKASFEFYLPGPFEVASNARLETLEDGTVLLVMSEDQDAVFDAISAQILGK